MRASSIGWGLACCSLGCASDGDLFLGFPRLEDASSVVLAVPQNGELDLYAAPLEGSQLRVRFEYDGVDPIQALLFEQTLDELGLVEGALEQPGPSDDGGQLDALGPIGSYVAQIGDGTADWIEDPALGAREARYKKPPSVCVSLGAQRVIGMLTGSLTFALALDDQHALLGSRDGELAVVSSDGTELIDPPFAGVVRSAFRDGDWIVMSNWFDGAMYRGHPSASGVVDVERLPDSPLAIGAYSLAGGNGKILAVTAEGTAAWFDGAAWRSLPAIDPNQTIVRAAWTDTDSYYFTRATSSLVRVDAEGNAHAENPELGGGIYSIAPIAELGTVLGTGDGNFLRRVPAGWEGLGGDYGWWGIDLESYAGGFFFLLASGTVGQYRRDPDAPFCTDHPVLGFINDGRIVKLKDSLLAAGWDGDLPTKIVLIDL